MALAFRGEASRAGRAIRQAVTACAAGAVLLGPVPGAPLRIQPAQAQWIVECPFCADKLTQLQSYVQQVEQVTNTITMRVQQAEMLRNQVTNMTRLPEQVWNNINGNFQATQSLFQRGQQLVASAGTVSNQLRGYGYYLGNLGNQASAFSQWSTESRDNLSSTLAGMGLMRSQMISDQAVVDRIRTQSAGSQGALQALQANTEMGGAMVNELHRTRELMMAETQMHANWIYAQQQRQDRGMAGDALFFQWAREPDTGNPRF
ncbi:P-type conjugative transfer protein TrbJ [Muricoccus vinaceus]|uniref:P-type conjugative transfer protein TrbJ n=1 Tax=Muricoccus vinaceus TaxID=424704 RepID=A0ABV6IZS0_9PROT